MIAPLLLLVSIQTLPLPDSELADRYLCESEAGARTTIDENGITTRLVDPSLYAFEVQTITLGEYGELTGVDYQTGQQDQPTYVINSISGNIPIASISRSGSDLIFRLARRYAETSGGPFRAFNANLDEHVVLYWLPDDGVFHLSFLREEEDQPEFYTISGSCTVALDE